MVIFSAAIAAAQVARKPRAVLDEFTGRRGEHHHGFAHAHHPDRPRPRLPGFILRHRPVSLEHPKAAEALEHGRALFTFNRSLAACSYHAGTPMPSVPATNRNSGRSCIPSSRCAGTLAVMFTPEACGLL